VYTGLHVKYPLFVSDFNRKFNFLDRLPKAHVSYMRVFTLTSTVIDFVVGYFAINQSEAKELKPKFFSINTYGI
jgi:hypothetical protein